MYSIVKVIVNAIAVTLDYTIDLLLLNVFMLLLLISTEIKSCFFYLRCCMCLSQYKIQNDIFTKKQKNKNKDKSSKWDKSL